MKSEIRCSANWVASNSAKLKKTQSGKDPGSFPTGSCELNDCVSLDLF